MGKRNKDRSPEQIANDLLRKFDAEEKQEQEKQKAMGGVNPNLHGHFQGYQPPAPSAATTNRDTTPLTIEEQLNCDYRVALANANISLNLLKDLEYFDSLVSNKDISDTNGEKREQLSIAQAAIKKGSYIGGPDGRAATTPEHTVDMSLEHAEAQAKEAAAHMRLEARKRRITAFIEKANLTGNIDTDLQQCLFDELLTDAVENVIFLQKRAVLTGWMLELNMSGKTAVEKEEAGRARKQQSELADTYKNGYSTLPINELGGDAFQKELKLYSTVDEFNRDIDTQQSQALDDLAAKKKHVSRVMPWSKANVAFTDLLQAHVKKLKADVCTIQTFCSDQRDEEPIEDVELRALVAHTRATLQQRYAANLEQPKNEVTANNTQETRTQLSPLTKFGLWGAGIAFLISALGMGITAAIVETHKELEVMGRSIGALFGLSGDAAVAVGLGVPALGVTIALVFIGASIGMMIHSFVTEKKAVMAAATTEPEYDVTPEAEHSENENIDKIGTDPEMAAVLATKDGIDTDTDDKLGGNSDLEQSDKLSSSPYVDMFTGKSKGSVNEPPAGHENVSSVEQTTIQPPPTGTG